VPEDAQIYLCDAMRGGTQVVGDTPGGVEFHPMPLSVIERERVGFIAMFARISEARCRIETAAEKTNRFHEISW
jgi:hypothetical protein